MAFKSQNMSVIAYANGYTMWCYSDSSGSLLDLMGNLHKVFSTLVNTGDTVVVNCADFHGILIIKYNEFKQEFELASMDSFDEYTKKLAEMAQ